MLRYTGHPIVDVGVATVVAFCRKTDPSELTAADLRAIAEFLEREYFSGKLISYLSCVFPNAHYVQPGAQPGAKTPIRPEKIQQFKREVLYGFQEPPHADAIGLRCTFCGEPAKRIVYRQHVPMITGEDVLNFFPAGLGGLPICGACLLAVQAFPLGARRCHGRALAVHSADDFSLTYAFASRFLGDNRRLLLLAGASGEKYPDAKAPRTLVIHVLSEIEAERRDAVPEGTAPSVTAYHLTNSGQGPDIDVYHLPSQVIAFLRMAGCAETAVVWRAIQAAAWERKVRKTEPRAGGEDGRRRKPRSSGPDGAIGPEQSRNFVYEDLFELPEHSARFVRTYFLRQAYRFAREGDPRRDYALARQRELVSWELARLFLREVMGMDKIRIEAIRNLGDRIAEHVARDNDRRLFQGLYRANRYWVLRSLLIRASNDRLRKGSVPLIGFDEFLTVFEEAEEAGRVDWALARDLVLIRVIEQLHQREWFGKQPDVLDEISAPEDGAATAV